MLHCGDCLEVMRRMEAGSVDLIYADPPYCTQKDWGEFDDRWESFDVYLAYMEERLRECHRMLAKTGSLYLHVDPNASHYLKVICDDIFGRKNFRNEIVWKTGISHNDAKKFGAVHDTIFYYLRGIKRTWNPQYLPLKESAESRYCHTDSDGRRWRDSPLTGDSLTGECYEYEYRGILRVWSCPYETMKKLDEEGKLYISKNGQIRIKVYRDQCPGAPVQSVWDDFGTMNSMSNERLGYPTQKPIALLKRIIQASSNAGDVVLDPFCGSGTTLAAAQMLGREWIGIDQNPNAIALCEKRLAKTQPALIPA